MESIVCMNELCGVSLTAAGDFKKGWALRSGDFAKLCDKCGTAYEQLAFCELFHLKDTGWRECTSCGKRLHCGCIASSAFLELLDNGGVSCASCSHNPNSMEEKPKETGISVENSVGETRSSSIDNHINVGNFDRIMLKQLNDGAGDNSQKLFDPAENDEASRSQMKQEEVLPPLEENATTSASISTFNGTSESIHAEKFNKYRESTGVKDVYGSLVQTNLTIGLAASSGKPVFFHGTAIEKRELNKTFSSLQQGPWSRNILPKVPKSIIAQGFDANVGMNSQVRVARPPVEGRIKNQLLPRYWPRITEQELKQISGDSNAIIVPLFEKVLSASDAGRIGRLVLPKACAEAYFPPISQPEGLPLRIQDVKGKEWLFQFRFWPNNNSRMYVLEGVTPCIQSMQLQAGDTVTFSRMEPEGKLLMGFRKAATITPVQSLKGSTDSHLHAFPRNINLPSADVSWHANEKLGSKPTAGSVPPSMLVPEKKRSRNIGSKSKRLLIESQDALELKYTWEESQDMLYPPTTVKPSIVTIEDNEFEEFEEPPVFGKGSIFTIGLSGEEEQWAQCDNCSKWRRLPADFLLPPTWTCQDNVWDESRSACIAPDELSPRELDYLLRLAKDFHRRRDSVTHRPEYEHGCSVTDAQTANSTAMGDNLTEPSVAATTKHPRHRPGCSCIVCIQPPSGKGKHNPTCTCNVCMTVKRRFKTLMLRKKKRQSEREEKMADKSQSQLIWGPKEEAEVESISTRTNFQVDFPENETTTSKGALDLNIHPNRDEGTTAIAGGATRVSMMSLLQVANLPLETYLKQNGLTSLIYEQQASSGSQALPGEAEEDHSLAPAIHEDTRGDAEELERPENPQNTCS